jgi:uncharacterized DUF497 family protein
MQIIWDERKRLANLDKHGMDFADIKPEFFDEAINLPGKHGRRIAVGWHEGIGSVVIYVRYGLEAISVISMRPASLRERRLLL